MSAHAWDLGRSRAESGGAGSETEVEPGRRLACSHAAPSPIPLPNPGPNFNRSATVGGSTPTWGCRKYYLLSPQPDSGGCELLVILFSPTPSPPPMADGSRNSLGR